MIKKIYKKTLGIVLAAAMMLSIAGCGSKEKEAKTDSTTAIEVSDNTQNVEATQAATEAVVTTAYAQTENEEFEKYIMDAFKEDIMSSTSSYHQNVKDLSSFGIERPTEAYWMKEIPTGTAEEIIAAEQKKVQDRYDRLMTFENAELTEEEYFTFLTEKADLELALKSYEYPEFLEMFSTGRGIQSQVGSFFAEYKLNDKQDVEDYLTLMEKFPEYVDYCVTIENWNADRGYAMQDITADAVIDQCKLFLEDKENHYLLQEFDNKMAEADFLSDDEKAEYKDRAKEAIQYVFEGIETIQKTVEGNKGKASVQGGLAKYERGKDYYNDYIIPYYASCHRTGDEIIVDFETRMDQIMSEMGMIAQSNPEAAQYFQENAATAFSEFDANEVPDAIEALKKETMADYPELPDIKYKASYLSQVLSDVMSSYMAYYSHPAYDDLDNNIIRVSLNHPENKWLSLSHEGCPGHMYQFNYLMSTDPNPLRKKAYNLGYLEGWAVYASYNTYDEFDFPNTDEDDAVARLFYLNTELGYLAQARMDLGINYEGWDVQGIADYMTARGWDATMAEQNYNTFSVNTVGLYLSYTEGYYQMLGMREYAEKELGSKFDVVEYHKVILSAGNCMYEELKTKVDEYIDANK